MAADGTGRPPGRPATGGEPAQRRWIVDRGGGAARRGRGRPPTIHADRAVHDSSVPSTVPADRLGRHLGAHQRAEVVQRDPVAALRVLRAASMSPLPFADGWVVDGSTRRRPVSVVDARAGTLGAVADDPEPTDELLPSALGPNAWLVDEMHEQYLADPTLGERELAGLLRRLPPRRRPAGGRPPTPPPRRGAPAAPAAPPPRRGRAAPVAAAGRAARRARSAGPPPASSPTWRRASRSRPPRASAASRPSCSRSTAGSSTATSAAPAAGRCPSPTSSATPSCGRSTRPCR